MTGVIVFTLCQLLVSGYACWRGGAPERLVGALLLLALCATILTPLQASYTYSGLNWPLLRIDLALLGALVVIALLADRFWPMWLAAFQLVAIGAHGVRVYNPDVVPVAYWALTSRIAYPMLLLLALGVVRHRRRLAERLPEHGWTWQRHRRGVASSAQVSADDPAHRPRDR